MKKPSKYCSFLELNKTSDARATAGCIAEPKGADILLEMMGAQLPNASAVGVTMVNWLLAAPEKFEDVVIRSPYTKSYLTLYIRRLPVSLQALLRTKMARSGYAHSSQFASEHLYEN
ncbi:MAG: hypothetical protein M1363_08320 [Gammaproteobacteria bacterium]|nr:hypothetical protein [Gammaproteobacteria bacterium]